MKQTLRQLQEQAKQRNNNRDRCETIADLMKKAFEEKAKRIKEKK